MFAQELWSGDRIWKCPSVAVALGNSHSPEQERELPRDTGKLCIRPHLSIKEKFITRPEIGASWIQVITACLR